MGNNPNQSKKIPQKGYKNINIQNNVDKNDYSLKGIVFNEELNPINGEILNEVLHRSVGGLTFLNKNNKLGVGSGVLISRDVVLTAAHNIFDRATNSENTQFKFYLGADGEAEDYCQVEAWRYPEEFKICPLSMKLSYNYAIIKLKKHVHFDRYLKLQLVCAKYLLKENENIMLKIYGFPCSYPPGYSPFVENFRPLNPHQELCKKIKLNQYGLAIKGRITVIKAKQSKIGYKISTLPGQSGCPVVVDYNIIAVHIGGDKAKFNVGRIVDISFMDNLWKWREELNAVPFQLQYDKVCSHTMLTLQKIGYNLDLSRKKLTYLNLADFNNLLNLNLQKNSIYQINLVHCPSLTKINLSYNQLRRINLSNNRHLTCLYLNNNHLQYIDVENNANLTHLWLSNNRLKQINVRKNIKLQLLQLSQNQLQELNVRVNVNITQLQTSKNLLREMDVSANLNLTHLYLQWNRLREIDVRVNVNLTHLNLSSNNLSEIDLNANVNLTWLNLSENQLYEMDVKPNFNLTWLNLSGNQLQNIDLSSNVNLTALCLRNNKITKMDLNKNTELRSLDIQWNRLGFISLCISKNVDEERYADYFDLSDQSSDVCRVSLDCEGKGQEVRKMTIRIVRKWMKKYSDDDYNRHKCAYSLLAF